MCDFICGSCVRLAGGMFWRSIIQFAGGEQCSVQFQQFVSRKCTFQFKQRRIGKRSNL